MSAKKAKEEKPAETPVKKLPNRVKGTYGTMYYVKDMAKAKAFFSDALGVKPKVDSPDWVEFDFGGHALCLHKGGGKDAPAGGMLILKVEGLNDMVKDLKGNLVIVSDPREVHPGAHAAEMKDRDGNTVSLYEAK